MATTLAPRPFATAPAAEPLMVRADADRCATAVVEIVIPVYNEEAGLEASVRRLHSYLTERFPLPWLITIADNASVDRTWGIACRLARDLGGVQALHLEAKGRGRALRAAWTGSVAPVVAYMDVDLSTDLDALLPLVAPLVTGHSDVAIGSRLAHGARVVRGPKREAISRSYNLILKATLRSGFSDAQCGFKAVRSDVARELLPLVEDEAWFFDTELLVVAERSGMRIHEVPVDWVDDPDSRVDIVRTATDDLKGIARMTRRFLRGEATVEGARRQQPTEAVADLDLASQLVRFGQIGILSTIAFAVLFAALVGGLGSVFAAVVALGVCAVVNTAANRRLTFSLRGPSGLARHHGLALAIGLVPLAATLLALVPLSLVGIGVLGQVVALSAVHAAAGLGRFLALRTWVFAGPADRP